MRKNRNKTRTYTPKIEASDSSFLNGGPRGGNRNGAYSGASTQKLSLRNFRPFASDANDELISDLPMLRARSRDLGRNSPMGCSAINLKVDNAVGTGLSMQSDLDYKFLGMSEEEATYIKREIEEEFKLFAESKDCDVTGKENFYGQTKLAYRACRESGDVFVLITRSPNKDSVYKLSTQIIEADRICNRDSLPDSDTKIAGITIDENGRATAYDIADRNPNALNRKQVTWTTIDAYNKAGNPNVIHLFSRLRPNQARGIPLLTPVIEPLKQLTRYSEAELQAAVISAAMALFTQMDHDAFINVFDDEAQQAIANRATQWDGTVDLENNGKAINLLPGESIVSPQLGRPNINFDPFFLAMLTQIGAALSIPREVLIKSFTSSYSASRAALLDFWRGIRIERDFIATEFCSVIANLWLEEAVASGRIKAPGFFNNPRVRRAYSKMIWVGDSQGSIDPLKDVEAADRRIRIGISTREKESIAYDGGDWESNANQLIKEHKKFDEGGILPIKDQPVDEKRQEKENNSDEN